MRVLEIGTGTGYNAALLAEIVGKDGVVATLDIDADVCAEARGALESAGYQRIDVLARDGAEGLPEASPFDRILATVGCPDVAPAWHEQLAEGGRLVAPLEHAGLHPLVSLTKRGELLQGRFVGWAAFIPIRGLLQQRLPWSDVVDPEESSSPTSHRSPIELGGGGSATARRSDSARNKKKSITSPGTPHPGMGRPVPNPSHAGAWTALAGASGLRRGGDPRLVSDLTTHHESWLAAGCPALEDWLVTLAAHNGEGARFLVEREHYNETVTLPES